MIPPNPLDGNIASVTHAGAHGWVIARADPLRAVEIEILTDGVLIARLTANERRPDLEIKGIGGGTCAFTVRFRRRLQADRDHIVQIRRASDGKQLPGSPQLLPRHRATPEICVAALEIALDAAAPRVALASFIVRCLATLTAARILR